MMSAPGFSTSNFVTRLTFPKASSVLLGFQREFFPLNLYKNMRV